MAGTNSKPRPLSYAIVYGLVGRPALGRKLERLLTKAGLQAARDSAQADILITHSAGCWLIPQNARARLVIWSGPALAENQGSAWRQANLQIYRRASSWRIITLFFGNIYQALRHPLRNMAIIRMAKRAEPVMVPKAAYVLLANRYDPWPHSHYLDACLQDKDWAFLSMPGSHDDIWEHPERYAPIIDHYARLLAQTDTR